MAVIYQFADFEINVERGTLTRRGYSVPMQEQPLRLLLLLASQPGVIVSREEIQAHLWPGNTFVEFDQSLRVAVSKLREALRDSATTPIYVETIPRRGYCFIAPVTVVEQPAATAARSLSAGDSSPSAGEKDEVFEGIRVLAAPSPGFRARISFTRLVLPAVALMLIFTATFYLVHKRLQPVVAPTVSAEPVVRRSVAVLGLRNLTGSEQDRWLSTALTEMLSTELAGNDHLRVISGEEVARAGLAEPTATSPSHESLAQYANRLGANTIVYGAYTVSREKDGKSAAKLRLDLRLEDLSSDAPPMTLVKTGLTSDLFTLVSASGAEMRQRFGLGDISADSVAAVRRTLPTDQVAAQFYAEGLQRLRDFDPPGARDLLQKAAHIEPGHAGTHLALAEAWHAMGYENEARSEAVRAVALGAGLPREELLEMQGELASFSSDWPHAMEIFRSLLTFYPDSVRYGLLLVRAQKGASRFEESLATLQSMRHPGLSRADEARIDLAESNDDLQLGNFRQAVAAADKAILIGTELGQNLMRAEGLWQKASGLERLGNSQDSLAASAQAQTLYHAAGDKQGQALALLMSGDVLYDSARTGEARKDFEDALALFKELGHVRNSSITMERIGNSYFDEGALTQSQHNYELALEGYKQTHWDSGMASAIGNLANVKETEGDLAGALESNAQGLALFEQVKDKRGTASTLSNMGNLEVEEGNLDLAGDYFTRAADVTVEISYTRGLAYARIGQGDVSLARNDISGALHQYEQAAKAIEGMDEPALQCAVQISQGIATLQGGNGKQAIGPLQQAADAALKIKEHGLATSALAALARAQLQAGKVPDAADSANRAVAESKAQFAPVSRLIATLALARVQIAQGNSRAAQESLRAAIPIAGHDGFLPLAMEARILEGRTVAGKDERRRQLDALSGEAASRGWKLLAADARRTSQ